MSRDAEIQRLIDIVNASEVNRISKPFAVEDLYKEDKKEELQEAIRVQVDTPEEAQLFMSIMQNAGIENREAHAEAEEEIEQGADYRNSPDEKYDDDDPLDTYSTKPNKQKMFRRTGSAGDNPLTMAEQLMAEWQESKDTSEEIIGEDMVDDLEAKIDKLAAKPNKTQAEKDELDKLEDRMADISADLDD